MKALAITLALSSSTAHAVDPHILIDARDLKKWDLILERNEVDYKECDVYRLSAPKKNVNSELAQPFNSATYVRWLGKPELKEIFKSDFYVPVAIVEKDSKILINDLCVKSSERAKSYIVLSYTWGAGHPPTVLYVKLSASK